MTAFIVALVWMLGSVVTAIVAGAIEPPGDGEEEVFAFTVLLCWPIAWTVFISCHVFMYIGKAPLRLAALGHEWRQRRKRRLAKATVVKKGGSR